MYTTNKKKVNMKLCKYIVIVKYNIINCFLIKCVVRWINSIYTWRSKFIKINYSFDFMKYKATRGIPVTVLNLKTKESFEYLSIVEAARSLGVYPNKVRRIIRKDKPYLEHYSIITKDYINLNDIGIFNLLYILCVKCLTRIYKTIRINIAIIMYILFWVILGIILYKYILYLIITLKDIYYEYLYTICEIKINYLNRMLEHRSLSHNKGCIESISTRIFAYKSVNFYNGLEFDCIHSYKSSNLKYNIYQPIINEINLDFRTSFSEISSSPVIERIDINKVFNKIIEDTTHIVESNNSLGINNNRDSLKLDTFSLRDDIKNKELLNYQSNILYLLINKLSPSIY